MAFNGTTLKFDISELRQGINEANALIKTNESEWRVFASSMDDWSNTAGGLAERNASLNRQLEEQKRKVENQTKIVEDYTAAFGESSETTQKQIQILNAYKTALNNTAKEIDGNTAKIAELQKAEAKEGKTTKELQAETQELAAVRKAHKKTIAETERRIDKLTSVSGDHADEIDQLRKKLAEERKALEETGGAVEDLADDTDEAEKKTSKFSTTLGGIGKVATGVVAGLTAIAGAVGGAVAGMVSLANSTRDSRASFATLENTAKKSGRSVESMTESLRDVVAVTGDVEAGIEGMNMLSNLKGTDRDIAAISNALAGASSQFAGLKFESLAEGLQETLATGKTVGPFAELVNRAGGSVEDLDKALAEAGDEAGRTQVAMDWLAQSGIGAVADSFREANPALAQARQAELDLQIATNALGAVAEPLAGKITAMKASFLTGLIPAIEGSASAFGDLVDGVADADKDLVYNIGYLIGSATGTIRGWWAKAKPALQVMFGEVFPMLLQKVVEEVPKLVAGMAQSIGDNAPSVFGKITDLVLGITTTIADSVPDVVNAGVALLNGLVDSIFIVSETILDDMPQVIIAIVNGLGAGAMNVLEGAGKLFDNIVGALPAFLENLKTNLPLIIETIIDKLAEWLPQVAQSAAELFGKVVDAIPNLLVLLATELPRIITKIVTTLLEGLPQLADTALSLFGELVKAIPSAVIELGKALPQIIIAIVNGLAAGASEIYEVGVNILKGIWQGISDTVGWLGEKLGEIFGKDGLIIGGIKKLLGIHSPSKEAAELGDYFMQGFEDGLNQRARPTEQVAEQVMTGVVNAANNAVATNGTKTGDTFWDSLKSAFGGGEGQMQSLVAGLFEGAITGDTSVIDNALNSVGDFLVSGLQSVISSSIPVVGGFLSAAVGGIYKGIKGLEQKRRQRQEERKEADRQIEYAELLAKAQAEAYTETIRQAKKGISQELGGVSSAGVKSLVEPVQQPQNVVNYTQNNYSPKALSAKEIYRNNNRAINLLQQGVKA